MFGKCLIHKLYSIALPNKKPAIKNIMEWGWEIDGQEFEITVTSEITVWQINEIKCLIEKYYTIKKWRIDFMFGRKLANYSQKIYATVEPKSLIEEELKLKEAKEWLGIKS